MKIKIIILQENNQIDKFSFSDTKYTQNVQPLLSSLLHSFYFVELKLMAHLTVTLFTKCPRLC